MKNAKRILGVALALIMIFNVFAVGTFAAFPDDTAVKLMIRADKATYAPGDEVVLTFSEQVIAEVGDMWIGGQYEIAYPTAVFSPFNATSNVLEDHGFTAIAPGYDAGISTLQLPEHVASSGITPELATLYGWDERICYVVCDDSTNIDCTSATDLFTVKLVIDPTAADGTYTIGYNPQGYEDMNAYSNDAANGGLYGTSATDWGFSVPNMYEYGTCTITVSSGATPEVTHVKQQSKWNGGNDKNTAENYLFGFVGQFTGIDVVTNEVAGRQEVTNIQSITATATVNGGASVVADVQTIWEAAGGYQFRAVFRGFAPTSSDSVSVVFAVTMSDGTTVYTSPAEVKVVNDIYTASVAAGMPAVA